MILDALPWKVLVRVTEISDGGLRKKLEPSEADCAAIAAVAELQRLSELVALFELKTLSGGRVRVTGTVRAKAVQTCVVTLEPVDTAIDEDVDTVFAEVSEELLAARGPHDPTDETEEPPEPIINGAIDLGALATEFLILGLDPYPRKPGASFDVPIEPEDPEDHPFAALAALKKADTPKKPKKSNDK